MFDFENFSNNLQKIDGSIPTDQFISLMGIDKNWSKEEVREHLSTLVHECKQYIINLEWLRSTV